MTAAPELLTFLEHDIEGYLFHDLRVMQAATVPPEAPGGGLGYPLLMTSLAGIELLGAVLSTGPFDTRHGRDYFKDYWQRFLYPGRPPGPEVDIVYQLARHGIAHNFLLKGPLGVTKGEPAHHLKRAGSRFLIDAATLADHLIDSYENRVKPHLDSPTVDVDAAQMLARVREMAAAYRSQAATALAPLAGPTGPSSTPPPQAGPSGPAGPFSSNISGSGLP